MSPDTPIGVATAAQEAAIDDPATTAEEAKAEEQFEELLEEALDDDSGPLGDAEADESDKALDEDECDE